jgi:uncharacterized protein YcbX
MHLSAIHVYPIKSGAALSPSHAEVEARGLAHDRRWMIVDAEGRFLTGRELPILVTLGATPEIAGVRLRRADGAELFVSVPAKTAPRRRVSVWDDAIDAVDAGDEAARWLRGWLGRELRFVYMDAAAVRPVDPTRARAGDEVSFADGFPLLLISQAALDGLNARLDVPLPMLRFRPNLVIDGADAHAEDGWRRLRIGAVEFDAVKPCVRCVFTTVDPALGRLDPSGEPLRTLKHYRRGPKGITFGMNLIARGSGTLRLGDAVTVLE